MDLTSYLLGKNASGSGGGGGGGGADLSEYFDTEIKSNTSSSDYMKYGTVVKKTPPFTVDENVTALDYCFRNWPFPTIDVSKMDTSNITDMDNMFYQTSLTSLDCSNFDTSKVTSFTEMFYGCNSLKYLNLSSFTFKTTGNNPSLQGMFNANKITTLDISNMDFSIVRASFNNMFLNCGKSCLQSDGAYADGIPYVYVKDTAAQTWVLTANNGHPDTWTTANVVIKQ